MRLAWYCETSYTAPQNALFWLLTVIRPWESKFFGVWCADSISEPCLSKCWLWSKTVFHLHYGFVLQKINCAGLTSSFSMTDQASLCALYSSCLRSGFSWNRGTFFTGSSLPKLGDWTFGTNFTSSTKMKGLNMDLEKIRSVTNE